MWVVVGMFGIVNFSVWGYAMAKFQDYQDVLTAIQTDQAAILAKIAALQAQIANGSGGLSGAEEDQVLTQLQDLHAQLQAIGHA